MVLPWPLAVGFLQQNRPGKVLESVKEDCGPIPATMYVAGFPCQPYSFEGAHGGLKGDARGAVFFDMVKRLSKISNSVKAVILENVPGLLSSTHAHDWQLIQDTLTKALPHFRWHFKVLDSSDFDTPQSRKRLFMVGLDSITLKHPFEWPQPMKPVTLSQILDPFPPPGEILPPEKELSMTAKRNIKIAVAQIKKTGENPFAQDVPFAVDVDTGRCDDILWTRDMARTLTRSRGGSGGPYILNRKRRLNIFELARLHGCCLERWDISGISIRQVGQMCLGRVMACLHVFSCICV